MNCFANSFSSDSGQGKLAGLFLAVHLPAVASITESETAKNAEKLSSRKSFQLNWHRRYHDQKSDGLLNREDFSSKGVVECNGVESWLEEKTLNKGVR